MKPYRDVFGNPLTKKDVTAAVAVMVQTGNPNPSNLQRHLKFGYGKAARISGLLCDAGVTTSTSKKPRTVILRNESQAINAALRQLKKGKRS